MTQQETELKPCPFCNAPLESRDGYTLFHPRTPCFLEGVKIYSDEIARISAWNTRIPDTAQLDKRLEAWEDAAEAMNAIVDHYMQLLKDKKELMRHLNKAVRTGFPYDHHDLREAEECFARLSSPEQQEQEQ